MRTLYILSQFLIASATPPSHGTMVAFVQCECVDPTAESTELYPIFEQGQAVHSLYKWFKLDEETFIELARRAADVAHKAVILKPAGVTLSAYMESLSRRGLTPDQITTELLKKYYKSLRSKTALLEIAQRGEDDDEDDD
jgi:hypothetical protein